MKKACVLILSLLLPSLLGLVVWQTGRVADLREELKSLEDIQSEWVNHNAKLIAGIAAMANRERLDETARESDGMIRGTPERELLIEVKPKTVGTDG